MLMADVERQVRGCVLRRPWEQLRDRQDRSVITTRTAMLCGRSTSATGQAKGGLELDGIQGKQRTAGGGGG
jgi:hypothetical protein